MSLSVGIVGLPNVGKSTLFNALLKKQQALAANYPFATIEPNVGVVPVPDERLTKLQKVIRESIASLQNDTNSPPIVPATVEFYDIAGLVKGASQGEGLGNQFLSHIREVDAIVMVLRAFKDGDVVQTGSEDVKENWETVMLELVLADLATLGKQREPKGSASKEERIKYEVVKKLLAHMSEGKPAWEVNLSDEERFLARELQLLTHKPVLYAVNVGEDELPGEPEKYAQALGVRAQDIVVISAKVEAELAELDEAERGEYLESLGVKESGLEKLIKAAYQKLGLISFLTAGEKEVRAWTIPLGMTAREAAGVIHTDFRDKFINAQVIDWQVLVSLGGFKKAKELGKVRSEGKDYIMKDGEVVEFMIGR